VNRIILSVFLIFVLFNSWSQSGNSEVFINQQFNDIATSIDDGNFKVAKKDIQELDQLTLSEQQLELLDYLTAKIDLKYSGNALLMLVFDKSTDDPTLKTQAVIDLGNFYFEKSEYSKALDFYDRIENYNIPKFDYGQVQYRSAYALFYQNKWEVALPQFVESTLYGGGYQSKANYYAGVISDSLYSSDIALKYFLVASEDPLLAPDCAPYIAAIYQQNKAFEQAINYIDQMLPTVNEADKIILLRLQGDIYFELRNYAKAANSLQQSFVRGAKKASAAIYYKLAVSYEKIGDQQKAIENYSISALDKSEIGQLSAFQLGYLYIARKDYPFAVRAFQEAAVASYNLDIVEIGSFLAAKSWYAAGNYQESILLFQAFISTYPNSKYVVESKELLAQGYYQTSDYDAALTYLQNIKNPDDEIRLIHQKITFIKGRELYNNQRYEDAIPFLSKAMSFNLEQEITGLAARLLADCQSAIGKYEESIPAYQRSLAALGSSHPSYSMALYGLAYAYFNSQQYDQALLNFDRFVRGKIVDLDMLNDAYLRLSDCYYINKAFEKALAGYSKIIQKEFQDYALFQIGNIHYLNGSLDLSIDFFKRVSSNFPQSFYADNALFQEAKIWFEKEDFKQALEKYQLFQKLYPVNPLIPFAILGEGLSASNLNQFDISLVAYDKILSQYIQHPVAGNALLAMQGLQAKGVTVKNIDSYMENLNQVNPDNEAFEYISFEQSKSYYFNQQYDLAITSMVTFISRYPKGSFVNEGNYYIGESYFRLEKWNEAINYFHKVLANESNVFKIRSIEKVGKAYFQLKDYKNSVASFQNMIQMASNRREQFTVREGLMLAYFHSQQFDSAIFYSNTIVNAEWKPLHADMEAQLIIGRAYISLKRYDLATDALIEVMNSKSSDYAAEAYFRFGQLQFETKDYAMSIETLLNLISNYGTQQQWVNQAYLLLVDNYIAKGELFQAKATLKSIIEQSKDDQLKQSAQEKMDTITRLESNLIEKRDSL